MLLSRSWNTKHQNQRVDITHIFPHRLPTLNTSVEQDRRYQHIKSLYELYEENYKLQDMIQIYQEEISKLVIEKEKLLTEVTFLRQQLSFKTLGNDKTKKDPD